MTTFISYSGERDERGVLVAALREHGVVPWRDVEDLDLAARTTATVEAELAECSSVILWVNEQVLSSAYVKDVELPAIARAANQRGIRIAPVFHGLTPSEGSDRVSRLGFEIGENNGHVVDPILSAESTAAAIASRVARAEVRASQRDGRPPIVRLVTYDDTAGHRDDAVLNFDWRHHSVRDFDREDQLRQALDASTSALKEVYGACEIFVAAKAHLPIAVALGHAFAEPTGCTLRMDRDGAVYSVGRRVHEVDALAETFHAQGPITARAAALEVAVSRDTGAGVTAYVAEGSRYRERIALAPADSTSRFALDPPESCNAWANQIGELLGRLAARPEIDRVDLFLACPVELAVAVGWWSNASGPTTILNWTGKSGPYSPMWHLQ